MDHAVIGGVEAAAFLVGIGEHGDTAVVLVADDLAREMAKGDLPALEVEGVAVAVPRGRAEAAADVAVLLEPAQLLVVGDVRPDEVAADAVPGRAFGPERAVVEPLDRGVTELCPKPSVEHHDIRLGVADGGRTRREIAGHGGGCERPADGEGGAEAECPATVQHHPTVVRRHFRPCQIDKALQLHPWHRRLP